MTATCQVGGHPEVFAVGDIGEIPGHGDGQPLPMLAQVAIQSGRHAARGIEALLRGDGPPLFRYQDLGTMATVGHGFAVARIGRVLLSGMAGFLVWLVVHIARLEGMRTRWVVLANWVSGCVFRGHPVRLIAEPVLPSNQIPATAANPAGPAGTGGGQLALSPGHGTPKHGAAARLRHRKEQR